MIFFRHVCLKEHVVHGKNDFFKGSKILLDTKNNFIGNLKNIELCYKKF